MVRGLSARVEVGVAQAQGLSPSMEDAHRIIPDMGGKRGALFAAVFDGHGRAEASQIAAREVPELFQRALKGGFSVEEAFHSAYIEVDRSIKGVTSSGTTASSIYLERDRIHYAHVGDSRIVLASGSEALALTRDHKATDPEEKAQLQARGGRFWGNYVVLPTGMGLAMSRALGDRDFEGLISRTPDVGSHILTARDRLIIIGCDGLWDVLTNQDAASIAGSEADAQSAADALVRAALAAGSSDNVTAILLFFRKAQRSGAAP